MVLLSTALIGVILGNNWTAHEWGGWKGHAKKLIYWVE